MEKSTKIIITGAAGFIGSHLAKALEKPENKLVLIDDFSRGKQKYLDYLGVKTNVTWMDLRKYDDYFCNFYGADTIYHCACRIGNNQFLHGSTGNELKALQENLVIDRNVFQAAVECKVKKVIYTSSVSVYNTERQRSDEALFSEDSLDLYRIDPEGGYGWAKFIGEKQLNMMSDMGIKTGIARIFKSYGPCDDYSDESGQVVCTLMRKAINYPKEKYVIWNDGSAKRCLVYIDDLVDAFLKIDKYLDKKSITVNIGGNQPYSVRELAVKILQIANKKGMDIENDMSKLAGVRSRIPILDKAKKELNWQPTTALEKGLKKTYEWVKYDIANS